MPKYRVKRHLVTQPSDQSYKIIALTQGQNALVDSRDFEWLNQFNWCAVWNPETHSFYAVTNGLRNRKRIQIRMHTKILGYVRGKEGDHIDGNTLNNRRNNLRNCSHGQNMQNQRRQQRSVSGFRGVSWHQLAKAWRCRIKINKKEKHLGLYATTEEAARAYDAAARKLYGEFAHTNF